MLLPTPDIAKREKEAELAEREITLQERRLDADIRKKADADKYAAEKKAEAELYARKQSSPQNMNRVTLSYSPRLVRYWMMPKVSATRAARRRQRHTPTRRCRIPNSGLWRPANAA